MRSCLLRPSAVQHVTVSVQCTYAPCIHACAGGGAPSTHQRAHLDLGGGGGGGGGEGGGGPSKPATAFVPRAAALKEGGGGGGAAGGPPKSNADFRKMMLGK